MEADLNCLGLVREEINFELTICNARWGGVEGEVGHVDIASQRVLIISPAPIFKHRLKDVP
jgi:hypothetical protein